MRWTIGLTTVPSRQATLLTRTLASLQLAGFTGLAAPRLFVDGASTGYEGMGLPVTYRDPLIRTFGNWLLGLNELYIREPTADRYAMFQDDFVTYTHLREYLESWPMPEKGYWNLYTFPCNQDRCPKDARGQRGQGWFESDQLGRGAVALVFNQQAVKLLLRSQHMIDRPLDPQRGWRSIDGGISSAFKKEGWTEYVHNPSLVQHIGLESSMGNKSHPLAPSFRGEEYDARNLFVSARPGEYCHGLFGEKAYDRFTEPCRTELILAWRQEMQALENAIRDDKDRLAKSVNSRDRRKFSTYVHQYGARLTQMQHNDPLYIPEIMKERAAQCRQQ